MKKIKELGKTPQGERIILMERKDGSRYKIQEYFNNGRVFFHKIS